MPRAMRNSSRTERSGRPEQEAPGGFEVRGVSVVPVAADPVVAILACITPGLLEVIESGPKSRTTLRTDCCCEFVSKACLAACCVAVYRDAEPFRAETYDAGRKLTNKRASNW